MKLLHPLPSGESTSPFGWRTIQGASNFHRGHDWAEASGTPIHAAHDGVVTFAGWENTGGGYMVNLRSHDSSYGTSYQHMVQAPNVRVGQHVAAGNPIGHVGSTGNSTGPHLHFELWIHGLVWQGTPVDPLPHIITDPQDPSRKQADMLHRDEQGSIYQADDFGYDHILDFGQGMATDEVIYAASTLAGAPVQVNNRQRDLINSYARNRWNRIRAQIVADVAKQVGTVQVDTAAIAKAVADAVTAQGVAVDAAAIAKAVEATLQDEFAAIPGQTVKRLGEKLGS